MSFLFFFQQDSPLGVRDTDFATVFPAGVNAAATWQRSLIRKRGIAMGKEHKGKGVNVALGPMMNLGRVAQVYSLLLDLCMARVLLTLRFSLSLEGWTELGGLWR